MSPITPTIRCQFPPPNRTRVSSGLRPGISLRTKAWLTIATGSETAVSAWANARPASRAMPIVRK
jgi:hypothetical protein